MRAVYAARYGGPEVLSIRDVPRPEPGRDEISVRVHVTTVSRTDCGNLRGHPRFARIATGLVKPKNRILGMDFAGTVDAVGADVTDFEPGDRVFGLSPKRYGAHAEYLCIPESGPVAPVPTGLRFADVVHCEGVWYASTYLDAFGLGPEHRILIYGASGAIGTAAVQLAKARGADVTAVVDTRHVELAGSLGADRVVDYTAEDYTELDQRFDFVLDAVGKASYRRAKRLLVPDGVFSSTDFGPHNENVPLMFASPLMRRRRFIFPLPREPRAAVELAARLLEAGKLRAVVDRTVPFEDIVDAYRYVETQQKTGIVVVEIAPEG